MEKIFDCYFAYLKTQWILGIDCSVPLNVGDRTDGSYQNRRKNRELRLKNDILFTTLFISKDDQMAKFLRS